MGIPCPAGKIKFYVEKQCNYSTVRNESFPGIYYSEIFITLLTTRCVIENFPSRFSFLSLNVNTIFAGNNTKLGYFCVFFKNIINSESFFVSSFEFRDGKSQMAVVSTFKRVKVSETGKLVLQLGRPPFYHYRWLSFCPPLFTNTVALFKRYRFEI